MAGHTIKGMVGILLLVSLVFHSVYAEAEKDTDLPSRFTALPVDTFPRIRQALVQVVAMTELSGYLNQLSMQIGRPVLFKQEALKPFSPLWKKRRGTGVIISEMGHILTTWSVVEGASHLETVLADGTHQRAVLLGGDPSRNLAVLVMAPSNLKPAPVARSHVRFVGKEVNLLGLSATGAFFSVKGIVLEKALVPGVESCPIGLRISSPVLPGVSGGVCVDGSGDVIGIISGLIAPSGTRADRLQSSKPEDYSTLVVPADIALKVFNRIYSGKPDAGGWLGINIALDIPRLPKKGGALVTRIQNGSPAQKGGLLNGDRILMFNGRFIDNPLELIEQVCFLCPNQPVEILVERSSGRKKIRFNAASRPRNLKAPDNAETDGCLGFWIQSLNPELQAYFDLPADRGVLIADVARNSPAKKAGLKRGDILLELEGRGIGSINDAVSMSRTLCRSLEPVVSVKAVVLRDKKKLQLTIQTKMDRDFLKDMSSGPARPLKLHLGEFSRWLEKKADLEDLMRRQQELFDFYTFSSEVLLEDSSEELKKRIETLKLELEEYLADHRQKKNMEDQLRKLNNPPR